MPKISKFNFEKEKPRIISEVDKRLKKLGIQDPEGLLLISGFIAPTLVPEISNNMSITGPAFPMIGVVGQSTGAVYLFSFKSLFPDTEIVDG